MAIAMSIELPQTSATRSPAPPISRSSAGKSADAADILAVGQRPLVGYQGHGVAGAAGSVRQHVDNGRVNGRQTGHETLYSVHGRPGQCL